MKLYLLSNNSTLELTDGIDYALVAWDGLGLPPINNISETGPLQHGATRVDYRYQARIITLAIDIYGDSLEDLISNRSRLLDYLNADLVVLRLETDSDTRDINCYFNNGITFTTDNISGFSEKAVIELFAPEPAFYDPERNMVSMGAGVAVSGFVINSFVPSNIGNPLIRQTYSIPYAGSWDEFPEIQIVGPAVSPIVWNLDTSEKLDFSGVTVATGDTYTIDTRYGYKTIVNSGLVNKIADISSDSDLATFHLAKKLAGETYHPNNIYITISGATGATRVYLRYYDRFIGL